MPTYRVLVLLVCTFGMTTSAAQAQTYLSPEACRIRNQSYLQCANICTSAAGLGAGAVVKSDRCIATQCGARCVETTAPARGNR